MTLKEFFTKTEKYPISIWDEWTLFIKTLVCIGFILWFLPAILLGIKLITIGVF